MIPRYTKPPFDLIWSEARKFDTWLRVELAVLQVLEKHGMVRKGVHRAFRQVKLKPDRIINLENTLKHDVLAFTTHVSEQVDGQYSRFFHYGLTSSDVVDTALSSLLVESSEHISRALERVIVTLKKTAIQYKKIPTIGRTHGMHAEPTSFGLKFLSYYCEFSRNKNRLAEAVENIRFGKISGAVGAYGVLNRAIEKEILSTLGLKQEPVSTQVIPRDRHLHYMSALNQIACSIERLSIELRHLQRTEVGEIQENFKSGQKGSSAMPHKKNPVSAENLTGCSRLIKGYTVSAMDNVALWHERDISHSSVERIILPDATTLIHYMLERINELVLGMRVNEIAVRTNLDKTGGLFFSGHVMLACIDKGLTREKAYKLIQEVSHKGHPLKDELYKDKFIEKNFTKNEWERLFNINRYLKHVDGIYKDVLKFLADENGQGTLEYVLLMAVLIGIIITVGIAFRQKLSQLIESKLMVWIEKRMFTPSSMHVFPFNFKK